MATIKVIIYDDFGHEIGIQEKTMKSCSLHDFDAIEEEVELFRQKIMPEIIKILLESQQEAFKKSPLKSNGSYPVEIKTINGSFTFNLFRFKSSTGPSNYFRECNIFCDSLGERASYESNKIKDFACHFAPKMSYENVSELIKQRSGGVSISDQRIQRIIIEKSLRIEKQQQELIEKNRDVVMPNLEKGDLYDPLIEEVIWMEDGISVSKQKEKRDKIAKKGKQRAITDMILLEKPNGAFECIVAANDICLTALSMAKLKENYSGKNINLVAISDGSRTIKNRSIDLFGEQYNHILDWYHLKKKIKELMSMTVRRCDSS